jgi:hypothetical protein
MRKAKANGWVVAGLSGIVFAVLFVALGGISHGYGLRSVGLLAASGFLLGAIAAPEFEPKAFRYPAAWQVVFGALAGAALVAVKHHHFSEAVVAGIMVGGLFGFFAPYWLKYVQVPS